MSDDPAAGGASHERFLATRSFASLDGLRAISIAGVLWHHTHDPIPGWIFTARGFLGVDLFFVISGFLIVTLLLRERRSTGDVSLRRFYARRFLRIFPAYYATLLVVGVAACLKPGAVSDALLDELPFALAYVSNMVPMHTLLSITWSLSTEEQFYLAVPALLKRARRVFGWIVPLAYVILGAFPFGVLPWLALPTLFRETTFGPILLGVMLAQVLDEPRGYRIAARVLGHRAAPIAAAGLLLLALHHPAGDISGWPRILIHLSMVIFVAACVVQERHALLPALSLWPVRRIGIVSYGIYLYHLLAWHLVNEGLLLAGISSQLLMFAGVSALSWGVAELSYALFESRFLRLKSRFAPDAGERRAAATPAAPIAS
jgi:peptidoglycan/LPS O-acetylase OafA/YrhL